MTTISSAIAAALIASASLSSVAFAEGDYYQGAEKNAPAASVDVDRISTGSVGQKVGSPKTDVQADVNSGDYYTGANRPN